MKVYQISSGLSGPLKQSDFKKVSETIQICLSYLVKELHNNGHVEGLTLEEFQDRLKYGMATMRMDFKNSVFYDDDEDEEIHGTFECEFDWPTSSIPKDFASVFAEATNIEYVFEQLPHHNPALCELQIMILGRDENWMLFVGGGIGEDEGFTERAWKE